jgi:hypothetical protein
LAKRGKLREDWRGGQSDESEQNDEAAIHFVHS